MPHIQQDLQPPVANTDPVPGISAPLRAQEQSGFSLGFGGGSLLGSGVSTKLNNERLASRVRCVGLTA